MFLNHKYESFDVSLNSINVFKMKKEYALFQLEVIIGVSLKMKGYNYSMKKMEFFIIYLHQELLNKME